MEYFLREKRDELIWALAEQDYTNAHLARMFKTTKADISRCLQRKPKNYKPKWEKVRQ